MLINVTIVDTFCGFCTECQRSGHAIHVLMKGYVCDIILININNSIKSMYVMNIPLWIK